jgi:hypothetical protein
MESEIVKSPGYDQDIVAVKDDKLVLLHCWVGRFGPDKTDPRADHGSTRHMAILSSTRSHRAEGGACSRTALLCAAVLHDGGG